MIVIIVTLVVCFILFVSYLYFNKQAQDIKQIRVKSDLLRNSFYQKELESIKKLKLVNVGDDGNSDFEFKQAVEKIKMPHELRIQIYD